MNVLSLFDGIACGRVALDRAGIIVERYVAYEIDKYAMQVAASNYPFIEHCGDVTTADFTQYKDFDLLIGGSPCTHWSIAKNGRETASSGIGWELFMQYKRALIESECKWFLYENNHSIHKDIQAAISQELGVQPIMINSALVSAQQRKRLYWTNIPNVQQPEDKGVLLKDILEWGLTDRDKSQTILSTMYKENEKSMLKRNKRGYLSFEPVDYKAHKDSKIVVTENSIRCQRNDKKHSTIQGTHVTLPHGKSQTLQTAHIPMTFQPVRIGNVGDEKHNKQGYRIYSVQGKSVCLSSNGSGVGGKTGLYKIDLPDGDYIIRKLSPIECERLQTLSDGYTQSVSNTQRYKGIGNGWTVDVIAHILKNIT